MTGISFVVVRKMLYQTKSILGFSRRCMNQTTRLSEKKVDNATINLPSYTFRVHTLIRVASFFINFVVELLPVV